MIILVLISHKSFFRVRDETYKRLLLLKSGVLSRVLRQVLKQDPISPILAEEHYPALDRRVAIVLEKIQTCIDKVPEKKVLVREKGS